MKTSSKKAKGRALQNWMRDKLLELNPELDKEDVRAAIMGETGADIKLSKKAQSYFPFKIEAKNVERIDLWGAYDQASSHKADGDPIVVIKKNRRQPLILIDAKLFVELIRKTLCLKQFPK